MTAKQIVDELKSLGSPGIKKVLLNHCIPEPLFGVKVGDMKKIQKRIKMDYQLALDLYDTGIYDAMYLAGLIADDLKMGRKELNRWANNASVALASFTVAWVAAGGHHGWTLALEWIESKKEPVAVAGWSTLSSLVSIKDDTELNVPELNRLLERVQKTIHEQPNDVRSVMNGFVIALGSYVQPLADAAMRAAEKIGTVSVDKGATACQVPYAPDCIKKACKGGLVAKKRKTAKC